MVKTFSDADWPLLIPRIFLQAQSSTRPARARLGGVPAMPFAGLGAECAGSRSFSQSATGNHGWTANVQQGKVVCGMSMKEELTLALRKATPEKRVEIIQKLKEVIEAFSPTSFSQPRVLLCRRFCSEDCRPDESRLDQ